MKNQILTGITVLILLLIVGAGYLLSRGTDFKISGIYTDNAVTDNTPQENVSRISIQVNQPDKTARSYQATFYNGTSLENIMKDLQTSDNLAFNYEVQSSSYGDFITVMNGFKADSNKEFWKLQVNGRDSQVGISAEYPNNGDLITFTITSF